MFEYLRGNSYIPWGHYAANMANDAVRYRVQDLSMADMTGMRHLYYQRTYVTMARRLGMDIPVQRGALSVQELEDLRNRIRDTISKTDGPSLKFNSTLWGWNFGFDYAPTYYRLHASHQQIHQQFAMLPDRVSKGHPGVLGPVEIPSYACGDLVRAFIQEYHRETGKPFFDTYIQSIRANRRMDSRESGESSLIVYEDEQVMVFVPKAQSSQWELQLMTLKPVGNILEPDMETRRSLDRAMLVAFKVLSALGAKMITNIEYSKRFDSPDTDQRLLYAFLPRLPETPGAFSEAQLRWINGHYPEDFAAACRANMGETGEKGGPRN